MVIKGNMKNKRYFLDLYENDRGRFLSFIQPGDDDRRIQLAITAEGLVEVRNALTELLDDVGKEDGTSSADDHSQIPATSSCLEMGDRDIYFDVNRNHHRASLLTVTSQPWSLLK